MATVLKRKKSKVSRNAKDEPAWDVAYFYPMQGHWTERDYLDLDENFEPRLVELDNGRLVVLTMPDMLHQDIVAFLLFRFDDFVVTTPIPGEVIHAPLPIRLGKRHYREPDIAYFKPRRIKDNLTPPNGADLVVEVVGRGRKARNHDLEIKPRVYAEAKIPEYWIVDPETKTITVLTLSGKSYKVHGVFKPGDQAASKLLKGFKVAVSEVFDAGEGK
jgi:Uma2 family endonuclease